MTRNELTAKIRERRLAAKLTEKAAAALAGINQSVWHRTEAGEQGRVSPDTLCRMAAAVGLTVRHVEEFRVVRKSV